MADVTLYDAYNRPINKTVLDKELAAPSLTGIRSVWNYSYVTGGLTPARLATLLKNATEGQADEFLSLGEEMEEKDLHYASVLGTRKRAVARLPIVIESVTDKPEDVALADEIRTLFKHPNAKGMVEDCLDALGKGYSVNEIMWDKSKTPWMPGRFEWRDPRFFHYDLVTRRELRLKDEADLMNGIPLEPYKFIVHTPRLKTGIPIRGGLARLAAWTYIFKNYAVKDWMAFCEVFGMPLRLGKYRPGETEDNIAILRSAVANLGSDAAAVIPEGMLIEFIESAKSTGGQELFEKLATWLDKQMSKAILGQTMTADDGSSKAQAAVHNDVREDIRDADAEQLAETLGRDLVRPYIDLNHGPRDEYPRVCFREAERADIPVMSEALGILVPLGLRVEMSEVRDKLGFSDPAKDAECLAPAAVPPPVPMDLTAPIVPDGKKPVVATNSEQTAPAIDPSNLLATKLGQDAMTFTDPWVEKLRQLTESATSLEDLRDRIITAYGDMDPADLGGIIAQATGLADCAGRSEVQDGM
jgi:phage gp29-like protein